MVDFDAEPHQRRQRRRRQRGGVAPLDAAKVEPRQVGGEGASARGVVVEDQRLRRAAADRGQRKPAAAVGDQRQRLCLAVRRELRLGAQPPARGGGVGAAGEKDRRPSRRQGGVERGAVGAKRVERDEGRRFEPVAWEPRLDQAQVAHHQRLLARREGFRAGVADEHAGRRNVAEAALARREAEFDVLVVALGVNLRQAADRIEAGLGDVEAEADAVREVDQRVAVDFARLRVEFGDFRRGRHRIGGVADGVA